MNRGYIDTLSILSIVSSSMRVRSVSNASNADESEIPLSPMELGVDEDNDLLIMKEKSKNSLDCPLDNNQVSFWSALLERSGVLIMLLILQSLSSIVLELNEELLETNPALIFFLTMLAGAGGNAGNQASVRMIRGIALGVVKTPATVTKIILREVLMAFSLASIICLVCFLRVVFSQQASLSESIVITVAIFFIVLISIILGALLPLILVICKVDPAHSSTLIQVLMDISGVLIMVGTAVFFFRTKMGAELLLLLE